MTEPTKHLCITHVEGNVEEEMDRKVVYIEFDFPKLFNSIFSYTKSTEIVGPYLQGLKVRFWFKIFNYKSCLLNEKQKYQEYRYREDKFHVQISFYPRISETMVC